MLVSLVSGSMGVERSSSNQPHWKRRRQHGHAVGSFRNSKQTRWASEKGMCLESSLLIANHLDSRLGAVRFLLHVSTLRNSHRRVKGRGAFLSTSSPTKKGIRESTSLRRPSLRKRRQRGP